MYYFVTNKLPVSLSSLFTRNTEIHNFNTRNRHNPRITSGKNNTTSRTFLHQGPKLWSALPNNITSATSIKSFRYKLKQSYLTSYV